MLFTSISFIYYFLPLLLICYFVVPKKFRNIILLMFSFLFYFYGEPKYMLMMLIEVLISYVVGLLIDKYKSKNILIIGIFIHVLLFGIFKYFNFVIINVNNLFHSNLNLLNVILPIGISFYTFQIISYEIDINVYDKSKINSWDLYDIYLGGAKGLPTIYNNLASSDDELIVFRDSYGSSLVPLLISSYKKIIVIDTRYISSNILDNYVEFKGQDVLFLYSVSTINNSFTVK